MLMCLAPRADLRRCARGMGVNIYSILSHWICVITGLFPPSALRIGWLNV